MTKTSTMKPFAVGDIFLGCTYLMNVPGDDHAGEGRIVGQIDTGLAKPQRSLAGVAEFTSGGHP